MDSYTNALSLSALLDDSTEGVEEEPLHAHSADFDVPVVVSPLRQVLQSTNTIVAPSLDTNTASTTITTLQSKSPFTPLLQSSVPIADSWSSSNSSSLIEQQAASNNHFLQCSTSSAITCTFSESIITSVSNNHSLPLSTSTDTNSSTLVSVPSNAISSCLNFNNNIFSTDCGSFEEYKNTNSYKNDSLPFSLSNSNNSKDTSTDNVTASNLTVMADSSNSSFDRMSKVATLSNGSHSGNSSPTVTHLESTTGILNGVTNGATTDIPHSDNNDHHVGTEQNCSNIDRISNGKSLVPFIAPVFSSNTSPSADCDGGDCKECAVLKKKLSNSKQWNKFLHQKLVNTDKLVHMLSECERDRQRLLELQLAYDQRTREWHYQQEQLVQLLQEAEPLRERLANAEAKVSKLSKQLRHTQMDREAQDISSQQLKARIESLSSKVNPMNLEMTEKKLEKKMALIKNLRFDIEIKNTEIHNLKAYISDHKLYNLRQGKKSLWALKLAASLADSAVTGLDDENNSRLRVVLDDTENHLLSQFKTFRKENEKKLDCNLVAIANLPNLEQWLDDFDKDGPSTWDIEEEDVKVNVKVEKTTLNGGNNTSEDTIKSVENSANSKSDVDSKSTEKQEKKLRGPYKKKTPEERLAIKQAGAEIERMLLDISNANDSEDTINTGKSASVTNKVKIFSDERKSNGDSCNENSSKISYGNDSDSTDDFIDCRSQYFRDRSYHSSLKKNQSPTRQQSSPRRISRCHSNNNKELLQKDTNTTKCEELPHQQSKTKVCIVAGKSPFEDGSDSEDSTSVSSNRVASSCGRQNETPSKENKSELTGKCDDAKEPFQPIGRTIHGIAKVGRVFDRNVISSSSMRKCSRAVRDEPVKLGGASKVPAKTYNVKEIGHLMRETLKEKQNLLQSKSTSVTKHYSLSAFSNNDNSNMLKVRNIESDTNTPVKKTLVLDLKAKSLTKCKTEPKDPSMLNSSSDNADDDDTNDEFHRKIEKQNQKISNSAAVVSLRPPRPSSRSSKILLAKEVQSPNRNKQHILNEDLAMSSDSDEERYTSTESLPNVNHTFRTSSDNLPFAQTRVNFEATTTECDLSDASPERPSANSTPLKMTNRKTESSRLQSRVSSIFDDSNEEDSCDASQQTHKTNNSYKEQTKTALHDSGTLPRNDSQHLDLSLTDDERGICTNNSSSFTLHNDEKTTCSPSSREPTLQSVNPNDCTQDEESNKKNSNERETASDSHIIGEANAASLERNCIDVNEVHFNNADVSNMVIDKTNSENVLKILNRESISLNNIQIQDTSQPCLSKTRTRTSSQSQSLADDCNKRTTVHTKSQCSYALRRRKSSKSKEEPYSPEKRLPVKRVRGHSLNSDSLNNIETISSGALNFDCFADFGGHRLDNTDRFISPLKTSLYDCPVIQKSSSEDVESETINPIKIREIFAELNLTSRLYETEESDSISSVIMSPQFTNAKTIRKSETDSGSGDGLSSGNALQNASKLIKDVRQQSVLDVPTKEKTQGIPDKGDNVGATKAHLHTMPTMVQTRRHTRRRNESDSSPLPTSSSSLLRSSSLQEPKIENTKFSDALSLTMKVPEAATFEKVVPEKLNIVESDKILSMRSEPSETKSSSNSPQKGKGVASQLTQKENDVINSSCFYMFNENFSNEIQNTIADNMSISPGTNLDVVSSKTSNLISVSNLIEQNPIKHPLLKKSGCDTAKKNTSARVSHVIVAEIQDPDNCFEPTTRITRRRRSMMSKSSKNTSTSFGRRETKELTPTPVLDSVLKAENAEPVDKNVCNIKSQRFSPEENKLPKCVSNETNSVLRVTRKLPQVYNLTAHTTHDELKIKGKPKMHYSVCAVPLDENVTPLVVTHDANDKQGEKSKDAALVDKSELTNIAKEQELDSNSEGELQIKEDEDTFSDEKNNSWCGSNKDGETLVEVGAPNKLQQKVSLKSPIRKNSEIYSKNDELFGDDLSLSNSSDIDDHLPTKSSVASSAIEYESPVKENVYPSALQNVTKKLKVSLLDDIMKRSSKPTENFTVTPRSLSCSKKFITESQLKELERRKSANARPSQVYRPAAPASVPTRPAPAKQPPILSQKRRLIMSQRRGAGAFLKKRSCAKSGGTVTKKQALPSRSSAESSSESSDDLSDIPVVRRTPGKKPMIIDSDSDSNDANVLPLKVDSGDIGEKIVCESNKKIKIDDDYHATNKIKVKKVLDLQSVVQSVSKRNTSVKKTSILLDVKRGKQGPVNFSFKKSSSLLNSPSTSYEAPIKSPTKESTFSEILVTTPNLSFSSPKQKGELSIGTESVTSLTSSQCSSYQDDNVTLSQQSLPPDGVLVTKPDEDDDSSDEEQLQINISSFDADEAQERPAADLTFNIADYGTVNSSTKRKAVEQTDDDFFDTDSNKRVRYSNLFSDEQVFTSPTPQDTSYCNDTSDSALVKPISFFGKDILLDGNELSPVKSNVTKRTKPSVSNTTGSESKAQKDGITPKVKTSSVKLDIFPSIDIPKLEPAKEQHMLEAQVEYTTLLGDLMSVRVGKKEWKSGVDIIITALQKRISSDTIIPILAHLKPLSRAFIHHIIRIDPLENLSPGARSLCPELYKLFMLMEVIEANLCLGSDRPLEELVLTTCHSIVCTSGFTGYRKSSAPSTILSPNSLACLAAWHTASCCCVRNGGRSPRWQRARTFLTDMLCHYPGASHAALYTSLFLARFVFLRVVKYRQSSGVERVIMWLVHHGPWVGRNSIRKMLIDNMNARHACEKPPSEPLLLVQSILSKLLHMVDKKKASIDTPQNTKTTVLGLVVLSCWMGKTWVIQELLPTIVQFLATKMNVSVTRLEQLVADISGATLRRVAASRNELAEFLEKIEDDSTPVAPVKYHDSKLQPNSSLRGRLTVAMADTVRNILHEDD